MAVPAKLLLSSFGLMPAKTQYVNSADIRTLIFWLSNAYPSTLIRGLLSVIIYILVPLLSGVAQLMWTTTTTNMHLHPCRDSPLRMSCLELPRSASTGITEEVYADGCPDPHRIYWCPLKWAWWIPWRSMWRSNIVLKYIKYCTLSTENYSL